MFKKILLSLTLITPIVAQAEWIEVSKNDERTFYLSKDYITVKSNAVDYWVKSIIHTDIKKDGQAVGDYSMQKWSAKCDSNELALLSFADYKGNKILRNQSISYAEYDDVIPQTLGEYIVTTVCEVARLMEEE